jgi:catechol 2,3-dioxygenase-like lactoylglutathione lyase family enzyme
MAEEETTMAVAFNHAMVYSRDVSRSVQFYARQLGFEVLEEAYGGPMLVYARLKSPQGDTTFAIHHLEAGQELKPGAIRMYFEVRDLDRFCKRLERAGVKLSQPPKLMPWGWKHAYLDDPDGHEVSLYWAGAKHLKKTKMIKSAGAK